MAPGFTQYPEVRVTTENIKSRVEVFMEGEKIAESKRAIRLTETGYPPVIYIPRDDIHGITLMKEGDYHCPFKGHAELYSIKHGASRFERAAWSYVKPYDDVLEIKNYVAFYPNKVQFMRLTG